MSYELIDGKLVASKIREEIKDRVAEIKSKHSRIPGLAAILVGDDPASEIYVRNKRKACEDVGIYSEEHKLSGDIAQEDLLKLINRLNGDENINGILVQLPLPEHIDDSTVLNSVSPGIVQICGSTSVERICFGLRKVIVLCIAFYFVSFDIFAFFGFSEFFA